MDYREGYSKGFLEGEMIGYLMGIINYFRHPSDFKINYPELTLEEGYYAEVEAIVHKYPTLSERHLARRIIYEATYLPPTAD